MVGSEQARGEGLVTIHPETHDRPHWVYRCYSETGELLYIGCTSNLAHREANHRSSSRWYPSMATVRLTGPFVGSGARQRAMAYEAAAIASERPTHNADASAVMRQNWATRNRSRAVSHEQGRTCNEWRCRTCGGRMARIEALYATREGTTA